MSTVTDYQAQANNFLAEHQITFKTELVGNDCPKFCEDAAKGKDMDKLNTFPRSTHIHGKHYRCTFTREKRNDLAIDFWNSYNDEEFNFYKRPSFRVEHSMDAAFYQLERQHGNHAKARLASPRTPTPYDVLASIQKSEPGTFEEFCSDFGYDTDSRKAFETYNAVRDEWIKVYRFFTPEELTEAQEIA